MNVFKLRTLGRCSKLVTLRSAHTAAKVESEIEVLTKQDAKISEGSAGITVASVENYQPVTYVTVAVKAGSKYENGSNLGVSHCLRNSATLSSNNHTAFALTRNLELNGSKLSIESTREHMLYTLQCNRDEVDSGLGVLADIVTQPAFKEWEVNDSAPRMNVDLAMYENSPEAVLMENLHKVAFRGGLDNSLYSPRFMVGKHNSTMLHDFVKSNYLASRTSVVGVGINHDHLQSKIDQLFNLHSAGSTTGQQVSKFAGGEIRVEADIPFVQAAIVAEGAGLSNVKDALSLGVLQCILGTGSHNKLSSGKFSILGEAAAKCTQNPFAVSSLNINYADTGMFGVYVVGHPNDMSSLVKSIASQMRKIGTDKKITDSVVENAKHKLKAKLHQERDSSKGMVSAMAVEASVFKKLLDLKDYEKIIDDLKVSDITAIASKVTKTKPAMAAVGRLHSTPHLDELL
ncbi:cytochrome b-c1 complex subunit 2, mitochondrial-like [Uloborus diversus]|uniref:cytochrome b-c1 complex subunit 2, mitochondrial-like n=1 Tax=Uloborus diversus TaxID=327109 RepID=UPI0024093000|nr:cytochrome b-c1 complex subunit 2, mitochondrial-like [Uloborus diversus]